MALVRSLAAAVLLVLAACATPQPDQGPRPNVYVMRHLQKAAGQDPGLTEEGQRYAVRLADRLAQDPPAAIYVSTTRRAQETAAVLAGRLGITPKTYDPSNTPAMIERVDAEAGTVLIVGHSNTVPDIVEQLGGARPAPLQEDDYGQVWRVYGPGPRTDRFTISDWILIRGS
jgi:broad specificity phosphatase PhoE